MSHLISNWWEQLDRPHRIRDQHFGLGLLPEHLSILPSDLLDESRSYRRARLNQGINHYYRPWGDLLRRENDGGFSTVKADKDHFQAVLDVQQFAPDEINVKVVDKCVIVEGSHDEKKDEHGWVTRKFTRRYLIPEQCNLDKAESKLSSDGVLTISVPRKEPPRVEGERIINIQHTGKPAVHETQPEEKNIETNKVEETKAEEKIKVAVDTKAEEETKVEEEAKVEETKVEEEVKVEETKVQEK